MKKALHSVLLSAFVAVMIAGCGGNTKTKTNNDTATIKPDVKEEVLPENPLFLEGIYATSVNMPEEKYNTDKLFDNSEDFWATMPGAGPDEGVMLYLPKTTELSKIEVSFSGDASLEKIVKIGLYIDGTDVKTLTAKDNTYSKFKGAVSSIFLRVVKTENIETSKPTQIDYVLTTSTSSFNSDKSVGIDEIILYDKEGKKYGIVPPKKVKGEVIASTVLEPVTAYNPEFLFDSRFDYGWAEGNQSNSGVGEIIEFNFDETVSINKLKIWNGFQRSKSHFQSNARVKKFSFGVKGKPLSTYELKDKEAPQEVVMNNTLSGKDFVFKVEEVYEGSKYQDLVISEMRLFDGKRWFIPTTTGIEKKKKQLIDKVKGNILEKMLDKWIFEEIIEEDYLITNQSLILRSNQSFVIWQQETNKDQTDGFAKQTVMDGNWEIISMDQNSAKIKIFGKRKILSVGYGNYKGVEDEANTTIFSDVLTISPKLIKGEKFFDSIKNFLSE
jgi:hypothetical protein